VSAWRVLGMSDVCPMRRLDPGPLFCWAALAARGLAIAPPPVDTPVPAAAALAEGAQSDEVAALQRQLQEFGYDLQAWGGQFDATTHAVVRAFQMHFCAHDTCSGVADARTQATLGALLAARPANA